MHKISNYRFNLYILCIFMLLSCKVVELTNILLPRGIFVVNLILLRFTHFLLSKLRSCNVFDKYHVCLGFINTCNALQS